MARNRKRTKDRRSRRLPGATPDGPGLATARREPDGATPDSEDHATPLKVDDTPLEDGDEMPGALEHATPDVELAEAQLALGRPARAEEVRGGALESMLEDEGEEDLGGGDRGGDGPPPGTGIELADPGPPGSAGPGGADPVVRPHPGGRLVNFIQGSWRELQRVQWPDRRQVMQATGVVIGFVIVAGAFLGVADLVAGKLVTFILK
ncbi:MAG: preprotein translocase subunit SecE [Solirubrobacteraceae bacterium]